MPERLLFVISGIPGFCIELCCFLHPLTWPLAFLLWFFVLLLVRGHSHHDTQDVITHESPLLVVILIVGVFWLFCFCFVCLFLLLVCCFLVFACLLLWFVLCFWFSCWDGIHYQYFCGYRQIDSRAR